MDTKNSDSLYDNHLKNINGVKFTRRQIDVIACLLHVWRDKDIARKLNISPNTVGVHLNAISDKVGFGGRQNILSFVKRSGKEELMKSYYQALISGPGDKTPSEDVPVPSVNALQEGFKPSFFEEKKLYFPTKLIVSSFISLVTLLTLLGGFFLFNEKHLPKGGGKTSAIPVSLCRSELPIPHADFRLERSEFLQGLDTHFQRGTQGIKAIALIGPGGSGKTVIARQYGRRQKGIVWEINAVTKNSLKSSFEALAHHLIVTEKDAQELGEIKRILESDDKDKKILFFIKARLQAAPGWLLIFDNVEQFSDIKPYFPADASVWGKGRVLLTTQNSHLHTHEALHHSLLVGELKDQEKENLFTKIIYKSSELAPVTKKDAHRLFLQSIPSFPLDVSIAAYYLKTTNTSYDAYLKDLHESKNEFDAVQRSILKEVTRYSKTRYKIITLSLKKILDHSEDFKHLILFMSLLNAQDIPIDLLNSFKSPLIVTDLIQSLRKYSLVTPTFFLSDRSVPCVTLHGITQDIFLSYFVQEKRLDDKILSAAFYVLSDYLDQTIDAENIQSMKMMKNHVAKMIKHQNLFSDFFVGCLESQLAVFQYFLNDPALLNTLQKTSRTLFSQTDGILSPQERLKVSQAFLRIGEIYLEVRYYKDAQKCFEKAVTLMTSKDQPENSLELSWGFYYLGNLYRRLGKYETARGYLEKSLEMGQRYGSDDKRIVRILSCLGNVYRGLGLYSKSIEMLEESLNLSQRCYPENHFRIGKSLKLLGNIYNKLGNYSKAQFYFKKTLFIYKQCFPENHINIGLIMTYLGGCLNKLGEAKTSLSYLESSLKIHQAHYPPTHPRRGWILLLLASTYKSLGRTQDYTKSIETVRQIYEKEFGFHQKKSEETIETARFLRDLGAIYLEKNDLEKAEDFINRSLEILDRHHHVSRYKSYEVLGEIFLKKSERAIQPEDKKTYKKKAFDNFEKALEILTKQFPKNSSYRLKLSSRLQSLRSP